VWKEEVDLRGPTTRTGDMRIPVVVLNTKSSKLQSTGLTHSWLDALGFPTNRSRDPLSRLVDVLESWETVAIAFEDAHRLDGTGTPGSSPVWETISCLDKRVDAAIVLSWTTEDDDVTVDGEMALSRGLQVESRSHHALTIPPLPAPKFDSRGDIRPSVIAGILKRLEMDLVLPNKVARDLTSPDVALALHDYSRGRVGRLKRAVVQMATRAMETGTERIDADIVRALLTGMPPVDVETRPSKRRRTAA
jgi:hypothetical protein